MNYPENMNSSFLYLFYHHILSSYRTLKKKKNSLKQCGLRKVNSASKFIMTVLTLLMFSRYNDHLVHHLSSVC